ncbi:MAG: hypothetical protein WCU83_10880 [Bacteroidia bacterium]|jgi:hypothetical protein
MIEAPKAIEEILTLYVTHVILMLDEEEDLKSLKAAYNRVSRFIRSDDEDVHSPEPPMDQ